MPRLTPRELAEARRVRADALEVLARLHHPPGYTARRSSGLYGHIDVERGFFVAPPARTRDALYVNLFLAGIARSRADDPDRIPTNAAVEYARETMELSGIEPPHGLKFSHTWSDVWAPLDRRKL